MSAPAHPWSAEIEPTAELVSAIVARHWPDIAGPEPRPFGRGWENAVFAVGEWLVRVPLREAVVSYVTRELQVMRFVAPRFPLWVPVPTRIAEPDDLFPWPVWLVEKAPGAEAEPMLPPDGPDADHRAIARSAGEALSALHGLDANEAIANGFRDNFDEAPLWKTLRQCAMQLPALARHVDGGILSRVARTCAQSDIDKPVSPSPGVPSHCDLRGTHIFYARDRLTALIDWTDAAMADPALDFAGLWCIGGEPFVRDALAAYTGPADDALLQRARMYTIGEAVTTLRYGIEADLAHERKTGLDLLTSLLE